MGNPYLSIVFNELYLEVVGVVGLGLADPCGNHLDHDVSIRKLIGYGEGMSLLPLGREIVLLRLGTMLVKCSVSSLTKGLREKSNSTSIG